jgi:hypothetical protein
VFIMQYDGRRQEGWGVAEIVEHIKAVMPGRIIHNPTQPALATTQLLSAIEELQCPICFGI